MFLTVLVPGPTNPKGKIDVFLQPLIAELKVCGVLGFKLMIFPNGKIFRCALPSCGP